MWPIKRTKQIKDIPTDLGNAVLRDLLNSGWRIVGQYPEHMFDKGIDHDSYTLKCRSGKLKFEWSNWDEWSLLGSEESVDLLLSLYPLALNATSSPLMATRMALSRRLLRLLRGVVPEQVTEEGLLQLDACYSRSTRHYHTLEHVAYCLSTLDSVASDLRDPRCVELALWFHDVVYDVQRANNEEQSAGHARDFLNRAGWPGDEVEKIAGLILVTRQPPAPANTDEQHMVDIDRSILGAPPYVYDRYERAIRKEYSDVPSALYARGRIDFLEALLGTQHVFFTLHFRSLLGERARVNLEWALRQLESDNARFDSGPSGPIYHPILFD